MFCARLHSAKTMYIIMMYLPSGYRSQVIQLKAAYTCLNLMATKLLGLSGILEVRSYLGKDYNEIYVHTLLFTSGQHITYV